MNGANLKGARLQSAQLQGAVGLARDSQTASQPNQQLDAVPLRRAPRRWAVGVRAVPGGAGHWASDIGLIINFSLTPNP
ncbi:hypothetical protein [Kamptonema formosum]|uniref:hypothetical protein n=1 Tax=Kamptonema formosum TaxID=331992 RepID=UPI0008FBC9B8